MALKRAGCLLLQAYVIYLELVYLVPSETACLANSPGRRRRTEVWISQEVMDDGGPLVVVSQTASLGGDSLEEVVDKGVQDGHGLGGHSGVGVHLLQHHVDVEGIIR